jgi:hypothetical protein
MEVYITAELPGGTNEPVTLQLGNKHPARFTGTP